MSDGGLKVIKSVRQLFFDRLKRYTLCYYSKYFFVDILFAP